MSDTFEQQWLSDLPSEWVEKRADFLCDPYRITVDPATYEDDLVAHYSIPQVQVTGGPAIEPASDVSSTKLLVNEPMLLVSKLNPRKQTICIAEPHAEYVTLASSEFVAINSSEIDQRYAFFLWSSQKVTDRLSAIVQSATRSHQRVNPSDITKLPWKWPPLDVQRRIARFLDEKTARIDALIAKKRELLNRLAEKRQALITRAVTQGLNPDVPRKPSGIDWLGDIPAHWEVWKLAHAYPQIGSGTTPASSDESYYDSEVGTPWITTSELRENRIDETSTCVTAKALEDYSTLRVYDPGSVFIAMYGATIGRLGINNVAATCNQACCVFEASEQFDNTFLFYWLWHRRADLISMAVGGGQPNLSQQVLREERALRPPVREQRAIAQHLNRVTTEVRDIADRVEQSVSRLLEYRAAIITAAVTGQIEGLR